MDGWDASGMRWTSPYSRLCSLSFEAAEGRERDVWRGLFCVVFSSFLLSVRERNGCCSDWLFENLIWKG